mmetsp:Transcript_114693/g.370601  ORF Transcript_114693/g.370601 Transcript_114693/m.370601 type:complete len:155 (+) Transcript_114693:373-837(+)
MRTCETLSQGSNPPRAVVEKVMSKALSIFCGSVCQGLFDDPTAIATAGTAGQCAAERCHHRGTVSRAAMFQHCHDDVTAKGMPAELPGLAHYLVDECIQASICAGVFQQAAQYAATVSVASHSHPLTSQLVNDETGGGCRHHFDDLLNHVVGVS